MTTATKTVIGAGLAAALVAGCSTSTHQAGSIHIPPTPRRGEFHAHGSVWLAKRYEVTWGRKYALCWAKGDSPFGTRSDGMQHTPFDDVKGGARVLVTDAVGTTLGVGRLTTGRAPDGQHCAFDFDVAVPSGSRSYLVTVAGHPARQFSEAQMHRELTVKLG